jgi:O-glycosyl hydrolase
MYVSPWSPPAFMKDNNDVLHGGKLKPEFAQSWANFYVKFIKEYEKWASLYGVYRYKTSLWPPKNGNRASTLPKKSAIL